MTTLTYREKSTVLAALRLWQSTSTRQIPMNIQDIADSAGEINPLDDDEIDDLCERINLGPEACALLDEVIAPHKIVEARALEPPLDEIVEAEQLAGANAADEIAGQPVGDFYATMPPAMPRPEMKRAPDIWHIGQLPGDEGGCTVRDQNGLTVGIWPTPAEAMAEVALNNAEQGVVSG